MVVFKDNRVGPGFMEKMVGSLSVLDHVKIGGTVKYHMRELIKT